MVLDVAGDDVNAPEIFRFSGVGDCRPAWGEAVELDFGVLFVLCVGRLGWEGSREKGC